MNRQVDECELELCRRQGEVREPIFHIYLRQSVFALLRQDSTTMNERNTHLACQVYN